MLRYFPYIYLLMSCLRIDRVCVAFAYVVKTLFGVNYPSRRFAS